MLTKNSQEAEDLYIEYLADFDLGVYNVNLGEYWKLDQQSNENERYRTAVNIYNDYVISVIKKALLKSNKSLAEKLAFLMREGLSYTINPQKSSNYIWKYDKKAKDEAERLIESYKAN